LIAPKCVEFYTANWEAIGTKRQRHEEITNHTGIPILSLLKTKLENISAAERLSWMANRTTTREEDMAYALLGLFDVHMPLLYGEGGRNAFMRLQLDILWKTNDLTILLYATDIRTQSSILAESPTLFTRFQAVYLDEQLRTRDVWNDYGKVLSRDTLVPNRTLPLEVETATVDRNGLKLGHQIVFKIERLHAPYFKETKEWAQQHNITHCVTLPITYRDHQVGLLVRAKESDITGVYTLAHDSLCLLSVETVGAAMKTIRLEDVVRPVRITHRTQKYRTRQTYLSSTELSLLLWSPPGYETHIFGKNEGPQSWREIGRRNNSVITRFNMSHFVSNNRIDFSLYRYSETIEDQIHFLLSLSFLKWSPGCDGDLQVIEAPVYWCDDMYTGHNDAYPIATPDSEDPKDRQTITLRSGECYSIQLKRRASPNSRGATAFGIQIVAMPQEVIQRQLKVMLDHNLRSSQTK
jgi:hypothetical protein